MDLSIIIVNYGTYELSKNVINSIFKFDYPFDYEIILVDNASQDDSFLKLKNYFKDNVRFISSSVNGGFAYGNNLGLKEAKGRYILLLNSDTIVKKDTLKDIFSYMESNNEIGACGCKVLLEDGNLDKACKRSFPNPRNSFYRLFHIPSKSNQNNYNLDNLDDDGIYNIDCLTGAFMFIRKEALDDVGFLDETFFMYGEDIDLCYRIKEAGWLISYYGQAEITHFKGSSSKKQKSKLVFEFYRAMYIFYKKHYSDIYSIFTNFIVYIGIVLLCFIKLFLNLFKSKN